MSLPTGYGCGFETSAAKSYLKRAVKSEVGNRPYKRRKFLAAIIGPRPVRQNTDRLGKRVYGERKRQANSWTSGTADI